MATRKKRRATRVEIPRYLIVRGKGNTVLLGVALPAISNAKLARTIDRFLEKPGTRLVKSSALIVEGEFDVVEMIAGNFGPPQPK